VRQPERVFGAVILGLCVCVVPTGALGADSARVHSCVNKRTGLVRIVSARGWRVNSSSTVSAAAPLTVYVLCTT
jgi:hypothetical protein